ncbi:MAG: anion transporter, partial [Kordiimonas sp.]
MGARTKLRTSTDRALYQNIGLFLGPLLFLLVTFSSAPEGLSLEAWKTVAIATWIATWWATEA